MSGLDPLTTPQFSWIPNVKAPPSRVLSIEELWGDLVAPTDDLRAKTARLRAERDKDRRQEMKARLPAVLISGVFSGREAGDLTQHSGYYIYDYDHVTDPKGILWTLLDSALPCLVGAFISPSGDGVKVVLRGPQAADAEDHRNAWTVGQWVLAGALERGVVEIDAASDVCRLCYLCDCSAEGSQIFCDGAVPFDLAVKPAAAEGNDDGVTLADIPNSTVVKVPLVEVRDMLASIGCGVGYKKWMTCILATMAHLGGGDEVVAMLREWSLSDGRQWTPGEEKTFQTLVDGAETEEGTGRVGIGTLRRLAAEAGWKHWNEMLRRETMANGRVRVMSSEYNAMVLLCHHPELKGRMWRDELTGVQQMEPKKGGWVPRGGPLEVSLAWDVMVAIQEHLHLKVCSTDGMMTALAAQADARVRNLRAEWMLGLEWDGVERCKRLFIDGFGSPDTELNRTVAETWMVGAAARTIKPGIDFQLVPVLIGRQGVGKSTGIGALCPSYEWFCDTKIDMAGGKGAYETVRRATIVELQELAGVRRAEIESVKAFVSARSLSYQRSYARQACGVLASWVFIGTTNENEFLSDTTGNRRFVPVLAPGRGKAEETLSVKWVTKWREQLWAEAVHKAKARLGDDRVMLPASVWKDAAEMGERATVIELLEEAVMAYTEASQHGAKEALRDIASVVGCAEIEDKYQQMKLSKYLRKYGWERKVIREGDKIGRVWVLEKEEL